MEPTLNLALERAARSRRGVTFIDRSESEYFVSYEEIYERARQAAFGLTRLGVRGTDRVGIVLPTSIEFFDAFYGALLAGAVPVPLYPPVRLGRLDEYHARTARMLRACGARLLLTNRRAGSLLGRTVRKASLALGARWMSTLPRGKAVPAAPSQDELALIQFSSGTQLAPKPVRLTHRQILANIKAIRNRILEAYPEGPGLTHVGISWLPLYHDMGLIGAVLTALAHPSDLVLIPPELFVARPALWLQAISKHRATVSAAPNFGYSLCVERIRDEELKGVDLSSWRLALNGAEPVTPSVLERFIERFRPFGLREEALTPVYGLAEAALAVTFCDPSKRFRSVGFDRHRLGEGVAEVRADGQQLVSVGRPLAGYAVRIVDEARRPLPDGRLGGVLVRGPSIMDGYHALEHETAAIVSDGWLDTGDTGFFHEGELFLYGRNNDLIILHGRNHSPDDIEQALAGIRGVRQGCWAALGIVREGGVGEELVVLVERSRKGRPTDERELRRTVSERILESTGLAPAEVLVCEPGTLPRTSSGKIRRQEAKRRYLGATLAPPRRAGSFRLAVEAATSILEMRRPKAK